MASHALQSPRGTRDFYPMDAARRRWLLEQWRGASTRHGFEEVDGPTFEEASLYAIKSGEGILSELFLAYSGKSPEDLEQVRTTGHAPYALRPEFTPTLARMYAARASALPKPTRWFCVSNFFRAERPQRGRLREFWQWNVDVLGLEAADRFGVEVAAARADAEVIATAVRMLGGLGLTPAQVRVRISSRTVIEGLLAECGVESSERDGAFALLDQRGKLGDGAFAARAGAMGLNVARFDARAAELARETDGAAGWAALWQALREVGVEEWCEPDFSIVRGLAYYTGTVFEITAQGERAVAGGGRYDRLIELFGGPPTPAVGFGMGDAVLTLLLENAGLLPSEGVLMRAAGQAPDVFVLTPDTPEAEAQLRPVVARLRAAGVHARHTSRSTRNVGKLMKEAGEARVALIVEPDGLHARVRQIADGAESAVMPLDEAVAQAVRQVRG